MDVGGSLQMDSGGDVHTQATPAITQAPHNRTALGLEPPVCSGQTIAPLLGVGGRACIFDTNDKASDRQEVQRSMSCTLRQSITKKRERKTTQHS